jgi:hypothetical protein
MNKLMLEIIQKDFHEYYQQIVRLSSDDNDLFSIVDDYCACHKGITFWKNSNSEESPERIGEYCDLRKELSQEIIELITSKSKR